MASAAAITKPLILDADINDSAKRKSITNTAITNETSVKAAASKTQSSKKSLPWSSLMRALLVELPLASLFGLLLLTILAQHAYDKYIIPIVKSYERGGMIGDFYSDFDNDFTYYNRHCGPEDISTRSANDLLIKDEYSSEEAANVMLKHGAVAFQNVLRNDTATSLRKYLATKHEANAKNKLGYNEVFWSEINRLSLGIGTHDHPAIAEAMEQVGNHPVVKRTLEGILGKDPALVEISTLTALHGAQDQGIHTDSDWFGSSLLYSRNFLHSYSMFISLQDTSRYLGATTICPGSHFCADIDLEEMCLNHGAFEVSTNGETGHDGVLRKGDAFLFNQNIWHRGPANIDESALDRTMFILTFVSAKDAKADRRRQGLGTYYYQRFNMWGSTFSMLKDATNTMAQPLAGMRALGLVPTRGITWFHQFSQQFANREDFYVDDGVEELNEKVFDYYQVPSWLRSPAETWGEFIVDTMSVWRSVLTAVNVVAIGTYIVLAGLLRLCLGSSRVSLGFSRLFVALGTMAALIYSFAIVIDHTDLAKSVKTGEVFVRPFPPKDADAMDAHMNFYDYGPTTFPERHDVLIHTRFDSEFLASFNRFLSFHPGNHRWESLVSHIAAMPETMMSQGVNAILNATLDYKEANLATRFLLQNPFTGAWNIMTQEDAFEETRRAVLAKQNPVIGLLSKQWKYLIADARFGVHRQTAMARMSEQYLIKEWVTILFGEKSSTKKTEDVQSGHDNHNFMMGHEGPNTKMKTAIQPTILNAKRRRILARALIQEDSDDDEEEKDEKELEEIIHIGDKLWVYQYEQWYEGVLVDIVDDDLEEGQEEGVIVYVYNYGSEEFFINDDIREYIRFKEGDLVEVDYDGDSSEFFSGTIVHVHPDGRCGVQFDDGEYIDKVPRENIFLQL